MLLNHYANVSELGQRVHYIGVSREPILGWRMNEDFCKQQAQRVRDLADKADPFTKKRLLDLADKYDVKAGKPSRASKIIERPTPLPTNQARP